MKKTNAKTKAAAAIVWMPAIGWIRSDCLDEWIGNIDYKPVFEITDDCLLFLRAGDSILLGKYSCAKSAKRGAERFAKRMREIFA